MEPGIGLGLGHRKSSHEERVEYVQRLFLNPWSSHRSFMNIKNEEGKSTIVKIIVNHPEGEKIPYEMHITE